jgi:serine/threonine protein kinase
MFANEERKNVKIVDFGISGKRNIDFSSAGTLYYMSPEILKEENT